jgi:hypothetical protein
MQGLPVVSGLLSGGCSAGWRFLPPEAVKKQILLYQSGIFWYDAR